MNTHEWQRFVKELPTHLATAHEHQRFVEALRAFNAAMPTLADALRALPLMAEWARALPPMPTPRLLTRRERFRVWLRHPIRSLFARPKWKCLGCDDAAQPSLCWCERCHEVQR